MAKDKNTVKDEEKEQALPDGVIAIIPLRRPIEDQDGNTHQELIVNEPTVDDVVRFGDVLAMSPDDTSSVTMKLDFEVVMAYLESCTGIHSPMLKTMHFKDLKAALRKLGNVLMAD